MTDFEAALTALFLVFTIPALICMFSISKRERQYWDNLEKRAVEKEAAINKALSHKKPKLRIVK